MYNMCIIPDVIKTQNIESNDKVVSDNRKWGSNNGILYVPAAESKTFKAKCRYEECNVSGRFYSTSTEQTPVAPPIPFFT